MKKLLPFCLLAISGLTNYSSQAQCLPGANTANINWDNLDFYYNSASLAPYNTYVTDAMAQTQKFGIGINDLTITHNYTGTNTVGENTLHTGETGSYGIGADVQFKGDGTVTLSFKADVRTLKFSVYDIDSGQRLTVTAVNGVGTPLTPVLTRVSVGTTILTAGGPPTSPRVTANNTATATTANNSTVNIDIAGPVRTVTLTITNTLSNTVAGSEDGSFWLSDISACVTGTFPLNYHKMASAKPFTGQPDYFLATPDNNRFYMIDPAGKTYYLFTEPSTTNFVNSFAYDQVNHFLYYVIDGTPNSPAPGPSGNKQLKKYDFTTGTFSVVVADMTAFLNIPLFNHGVESGAAAFYNGSLYFGVEGGQFDNSNTRESIIYKIDFDPTTFAALAGASQVLALPHYSGANTVHDWGDFLVKDGEIIDFNTARQGSPFTYPNSNAIRYNLTSEVITNTFPNPVPASQYVGQTGLDWAGNMYSIITGVKTFNPATGALGANNPFVVGTGPAWVGGTGDASEPFRPACDFGDAPASYEGAGDPAVHEQNANLYLGATFDREWAKTGATTSANSDGADEDGIPTVWLFNPTSNAYTAPVSVFNNTGAPATLIGWLDYDGDGIFDPSEGITQTVPSSATAQTIYLFWTGITSPLTNGSNTFLRIRLTSASNVMTTSNPTGYFDDGEVEDYRVNVNFSALAVESLNFKAEKINSSKSLLQWSSEDRSVVKYVLQKSTDGNTWSNIAVKNNTASESFSFVDENLFEGDNIYRVQLLYNTGAIKFSDVKAIKADEVKEMKVSPNPFHSKAVLTINAAAQTNTFITVLTLTGVAAYKEPVVLTKGINKLSLHLSSLKPGAYIVQIANNGIVEKKKIIIN